MNPLLAKLQPYPFERLRKLFAGVTPNADFKPISLGIGEPKHPTPAFIRQALTDGLDGLAAYPATAGDLKLREAFTGWLRRRYGVTVDAATQVLPVNGSREALFALTQTVVDPTRRPSVSSDAHAVASVGAGFVGWPAKPNSMGRGYPGHLVTVIDDEGHEAAVGTPGEVAIRRTDIHGDPDPIFFLGYWNQPEATRAKFTGDWWRTGDVAVRDEDGYLWYQGRADDVFKSAGYRIGPGEIENCLIKHPAVANCAVVPKPDAERGAVVKAYVVLTTEFIAARADSESAGGQFDQELIAALQDHVKGQLAPYEYPKEIEFIDQLPMTTTGKLQRRVLRLQEEERATQRRG